MTHPIRDCAACGAKNGMQVVDSRAGDDCITRRRRCVHCGHLGYGIEFEATVAEPLRKRGRPPGHEPTRPPIAGMTVLKAGDVTPADLQVLDLVISGVNALGMEFHPAHRIFKLREMFRTALKMQGLVQ